MRENMLYADRSLYADGSGNDFENTLGKLRIVCHSEEVLEHAAARFLRGAGVPAHYRGYQYVKSGIVMAAMDMDRLGDLMKDIYPAIAAKHHTGVRNVERAIRYAIERTWLYGNPRVLRQLFGHNCEGGFGKPTNKEFIATIADRLNMEYFKAID